jgi:hypothetical protein
MSDEKAASMKEAGFKVTINPEQHMMSPAAIKMIHRTTGHYITLKPGDSVENVVIEKERAALVLNVVDLKETKTGFELKGIGTRVYLFVKSESGAWAPSLPTTLWEEDFKPVFTRTLGNGKDVREWISRIRWERMAYRVGTDANPMDNYERTLDGSTDAMHKHWYH